MKETTNFQSLLLQFQLLRYQDTRFKARIRVIAEQQLLTLCNGFTITDSMKSNRGREETALLLKTTVDVSEATK